MKLLRLIRHLRVLRSIPVRAVAKRAVTLLPDLYLGAGRSSALVNITLELTYRCNLHCEFCFLKDTLLNQRRTELTVPEIARLAEQAKALGASFFLTGGEPFLRKDLAKIVNEIHRRSLRVGVNTNGLLVTPERGREIRAAGLGYIIFSLHGPREVHDAVVGRPGAFDRLMAHLDDFSNHKGPVRVMVNCVVTKDNGVLLSEVPALLEDLPLDGLTFQHETFLTPQEVKDHRAAWNAIFPRLPMPMVYQDTGFGPRDFEGIEASIRAIEEAAAARRWPFPVFFKPSLGGADLRSWYTHDMHPEGQCLYIWTDTRVEPDGTVNACQVMPTPMGNIHDAPLGEILNGETYRSFRAGLRNAGGVLPACARCCKLYRNPVRLLSRQQRSWAGDSNAAADSPEASPLPIADEGAAPPGREKRQIPPELDLPGRNPSPARLPPGPPPE